MAGFKRSVKLTHFFPVSIDLKQGLMIHSSFAFRKTKRFHHGVQARLAHDAGHAGTGSIGDVQADFRSLDNARRLCTANVVRVEVDRQANLFPQGLDQLLGGIRLAKSSHVLDGDQVGSKFFEIFGQLDIIAQAIFVTLRVKNVAGVANRGLSQCT